MRPPADRSGKAPPGVGEAGTPDARYATVRADLDSIFAPVASTRASAPTPARVDRATGRAGRLDGRTIGLVVALLLACVLIGLAWLKRPVSSVPPATPAPAGNVVALERNGASTAAPLATVPPVNSDVAPVAPVPEPAAPAAKVAPVPEPAAPAAKVARTAHAATAAVVALATPGRRSHRPGRTASPDAAGRPDDRKAVAPAACTPADSAWCLRNVTVAADHDLREAYEAAIRAKVKRRTLVHIHHDWVKYRRLANKRPRDLIHGYNALTVDVRRAISQKVGGGDAGHGR